MTTDSKFQPGDIARHADLDGEVIVQPSKHAEPAGAVWVRETSGLTHRVATALLRHVVPSAEHVGQWARITDKDSEVSHRGRRGKIIRLDFDKWPVVEDEEGAEWAADEGCAVLVAAPSPVWVPAPGDHATVVKAEYADGAACMYFDEGTEVTVLENVDSWGDVRCVRDADGQKGGVAAVNLARRDPDPTPDSDHAEASEGETVDAVRRMAERVVAAKNEAAQLRAQVQRLQSEVRRWQERRRVAVQERDAARRERDEAVARAGWAPTLPDVGKAVREGANMRVDGRLLYPDENATGDSVRRSAVQWLAVAALLDEEAAAQQAPDTDDDAEARAVYAALYSPKRDDWSETSDSIRDECRRVAAAARAARPAPTVEDPRGR